MRKSACIEVTGELDLYSLKRPLQPMPTGVVVGDRNRPIYIDHLWIECSQNCRHG